MTTVEALNALGGWLLPTLGRLSLELAILAAVIAAAVFVFRVRSPRLRHAFWGLVLAKPVATFLVASPLSLYWFLHPVPPTWPTEPVHRPALTRAPRPVTPAISQAVRPTVAALRIPAPAPSPWQQLDLYGLAAAGWLAAASLLSLRLLCGALYVRRLRRRAAPQLDGPLAEAAAAAARDLGLRRPLGVSLSTGVRGPVLAGVWHPEVLLPPELVEGLDAEQVRLVVAHESAHARRRDNLVLAVQRLAEVLLFFHPAVWWCGWAMGRDAEAACDEAVLAAHGGRRAQYARGLVEVAARARGAESRSPGVRSHSMLLSTFAARETGFARRIRAVLHGRAHTPAGVAAAAVVSLVAIAAVGLPRAAQRRAGAAPTDVSQQSAGDGAGERGAGSMERNSAGSPGEAGRRVQRAGGKVWIEGMEQVNWGGSFFTREDSQVRCLVEALRCAGREVDYAEVMGLSGAAFKVTMAPDLFVAEMHSEMGLDWEEIAARVWGVEYESNALSLSDESNPDWAEKLHELTVESVGRGVPLLYMNGEWNLLVGYREDGSAFVTMPYAGSDDGYRESECPGGFVGEAWFASTLTPVGEPAPRREAAIASLRAAVDLWSHPAQKDGARNFGQEAYEVWIAAIVAPPEQVSLHGNAFSYSQLLTSRQAAARYLRTVAEELGEEAAPHLRGAADRYDRIGQRLWDGRDCVAHPWEGSWTPENRRLEADLLRACLVDEQAAVAGIEAALAALGATALGGGSAARVPEGSVLLAEAVADFQHLANEVAGHRIELCVRGAAETVFPQPYCYLTTMLVQMHAAGWPEMDFETLAAVSGASAFFGYEADSFMPKYAFHRRDPHRLVTEATGFRAEWLRVEDAEQAWDLVREAVDGGCPVAGWHGEMFLLAGYLDAADPADRQVFAMKDGNGYFTEWWTWDQLAEWVGEGQGLSRFAGREEPLPPRDVALRVIGDLVALSAGVSANVREAFPQTTFGLAGIRAYADDHDAGGSQDEVTMCHPVNPQWTVRAATARYLEDVAGEQVLGAEASTHVAHAAQAYGAAYAAWQQAYGLVGHGVPEGAGKDPATRASASAAVRRAHDHEAAGIGHLRAALAAAGVTLPDPGPAPAAQGAAGRVMRADGKVWLEGLRPPRIPMSQLGSLLSCARHLGYGETDAWLAGVTGFAFALNVGPDLCPSGPSAWADHKLLPLAANAGLPVRTLYGAESQPDFEARRRQVFDEVRAAIDAGQPVIGTGMKTPEVYLVAGYDEEGNYLYHDLETSGLQRRHHEDLDFLWFQFPAPGEPADDRTAVREGLAAALGLAAGTDFDSGQCGLRAYGNWTAGLAPDSGASALGAAYNAACWASCRQLAAPFLREARERLGDAELDPHFRAAIAAYGEVDDRLGDVAGLFPLAFGDAAMEERLADTVRREKARHALAAARDAEVEGLRALAALCTALGGPRVDVEALATAAASEAAANAKSSPGGVGEAVPPDADGAHMLQGLEYPNRVAAEMACLEGAARFLGLDLSAPWIYGGTGHAFAITMAEGTHIASPYAWQKTAYDLAPNLGLRVSGLQVPKREAGDEYPARQREAWDLVRRAVDRGMPCYADRVGSTPDYALITGYDEVGYHSVHHTRREGPRPWQELGTADVEVIDVWQVEPCEARPDEEVVRAALETALERAAADDGWAVGLPGQVSGPAALDSWAQQVEDGTALRDAHGYNAMFWTEYREMAAAFLEEAKGRLPGRCDAALDAAAAHYRTVAERLAAVRDRDSYIPSTSDWVTRLQSPESAQLLREAARAERRGLVALANVLAALGGTPPEAYMDGTFLQSGAWEDGADASGQGPDDGATPSGDPEPRSLGADAAPSGGVHPDRLVLEGVPRMAGHTDRWRFTHFCHALDVSLHYLGEPDLYDRIMALSGAGFRTVWAPQMWDGGNSDPLGMAVQTLEPMRRAYWGTGYEMQAVARQSPDGWPQDILAAEAQRLGGELTDEAGFRQRIIESINAGRPVIAFGVIGPPEASVITGYDEGGDVLLGWNEFQGHGGVETEPSGYFRVRDWYPKTHALLLLGDKVGPPAPDELYRSTLLWAIEVLRTPAVGQSAAGPAAFEAWAADMANDGYFPADSTEVLHARLDCHWDGMTMQAERATTVAFLEEAADHDPAMAEHLGAAAAALQEGGVEHGVAPGERDQIARLADPEVRREVAESILATRDAYQKTADRIEQALLAAGVPDEEIPRPAPAAPAPPSDPDQYLVLEGVPKVGFGLIDGHVGMTPFPACMRAVLEYMGDDLGLPRRPDQTTEAGFDRGAVYAYLMGTTGAAFRLSWKPGWHGDNVASWMLSDDPGGIFRRGFAAAGYESIGPGHVTDEEKEETFRQTVMESIRDRGRPLIAHGVIGPPEESIIAGYGEGGATVMGWSFFQDREIGTAGVEFLPNGYFRKRHWVPATWGLMGFGEKVGDPPRRETYIDALKWALRVSREPVRYSERYNGQAAYTAWAEHILRDDEVAAGGGPDDAFRVHSDAIDVIAEGRHYAHVFLKQAAVELTEVEEHLLAAAACYKTEHDLMWEIWGLVGGNTPGPEQREAFLKPEVRRDIVPLIRRARDQDAAAAGHIEAALLALEVPPDEIAPPPPAQLPDLPGKKDEPHILPGLEFPKWAISELGCTHACLAHQGVEISRPWLYGGTARAFIINIHEDVDVESVTAFHRQRLLDLSPNLGFRVEGFTASKEEEDADRYRQLQRDAWTFVRSRISMSVPCYGWELKAPYGDYWIITGFDEVGYHYAGWETGGPTPWEKLGDQFIPTLDVRSAVPCEAASDEVVVREAFRTALWWAASPPELGLAGDAHVGPDAYEAWAASLEEGRALLNHHAYNASAWVETREMAVAFLGEVKERLSRADLDPLFDEAIGHYTAVRDRLAAVEAKYPVPHEGWEKRETVQDEETAAVLRQAGQAEELGLAVLGRIAAALE